jgi:hypothetical protein
MTKTRFAVAVLLVLAVAVPGFAQKKPAAPKAVVVHQDKTVDFTKFHTYSYEKGQPAIIKQGDERVVAGIEAQLKELGLTKAASGPGDVVVTYYSVTRTDVDLSTFDKAEPARGEQRKPAETYKVGTLVVDVKPAAAKQPAWRAKIEGVMKGDEATQLAAIDKAVVALFGVYPTRTAKK